MEVLHKLFCRTKMVFLALCMMCPSIAHQTYDMMRLNIACMLNYSCELPCRLSPYTTTNVMWFNARDEVLSQGTRIIRNHRNLVIEKHAFDEWTLRIMRVNQNYKGTYICKITNGAILAEITVDIEYKPKIDVERSSPPREYAKEWSVAQLTCIVPAIPEPEITWYRGHSEKLISGITGPKLLIRNVKRFASDDYTCLATNKHGSTKGHIRLVVNFAPEVTVMEGEVYAGGGQEVMMGCMVQASPLYDAFWTKHDGSRIHNNWKYEVTVDEESEIFPVRFLKLRIKAGILSIHDEGNYTCHGMGEHNDSSSSVALKVKIE